MYFLYTIMQKVDQIVHMNLLPFSSIICPSRNMILRRLANFIDFMFQKYIKFSCQNLGNGREGKNGCRQATFGFEIEEKFNFSKIYRNFLFTVKNKKYCIYVHFYLLYNFVTFRNTILCILASNMQNLQQIFHMNLLLLSNLTCP